MKYRVPFPAHTPFGNLRRLLCDEYANYLPNEVNALSTEQSKGVQPLGALHSLQTHRCLLRANQSGLAHTQGIAGKMLKPPSQKYEISELSGSSTVC